MQHAWLVVELVENDGSRSPIEEMDAALAAVALQVKAAHALAGLPRHGHFAVGHGNGNQIERPLRATGEVAAQPQDALALFAKGVQAHGDGPAVGPEDLVALEVNAVVLAVLGRIATKENLQGALHPGAISREKQRGPFRGASRNRSASPGNPDPLGGRKGVPLVEEAPQAGWQPSKMGKS